MNPNPAIVRNTDTIALAADHIMSQRCRRLPIVDENNRYLGVVGINCLLRFVLPRAIVMDKGLTNASFIHHTLSDFHQRFNEIADLPVTRCMGDEAVVVSPDTSLTETLRILYNHMGSLPVVEPKSGILVGVVTYWDVGAAILGAEIPE